MRKRITTLVAALGAVALVSGILVVSANAHIGASHSPIDTTLPDLVSAEVVGDDEVDFCFDDEVTDVGDPGDYFLSGYNADTVADGEDAEPNEDKEECILVGFDDDRNVANFTIAYITEGAAETRAGDGSPEGTVELEGSTAEGGAGRTVAPNLEEWDTSGSDEIEYGFDEQVDCDRIEAATAATFGYYDEDGLKGEGNDVTDCDEDGQVTVEFTDVDEDVDDAVRVFVDENQGTDETCEPIPVSADPAGCTSIEAEGDETDGNPDLQEVERTDDDEWTFTFSDTLDETSCVETLFHVYQEDGSEFTGTDCSEDEEIVEVTFDTVDQDAADNEFPLAASENAAVDDEDGDPSTIGDGEPGDSEEDTGFTDAPDLEVADPDATGGTVTYFFDEPIDDDFNFDENDFLLVDEDGDTVNGDDIDDAEEDFVSVEYDDEDDITDAIGAAVLDDAAADFNGDLSEPASVGFGTASTTTSTTTTTSGGTDSTPPPPSVVRVGTTLSIHYDRKPARRAAFKGAVRSQVHKCEKARQVELHRRGTGVVGRDASNRKGKWKVRYPRAQGQFFAEVLRKVFTRGDGVTVICKKDSTLD